jgi:hypothetical protein
MTRDDIIKLARKAGFADGVAEIVGLEGFARFAALIAAAEREACAKVADELADYVVPQNAVAAAIRARSNHAN